LPTPEIKTYDKSWATTGKPKNRERNIITSLHIESESMEKVNNKLQEKYKTITAAEKRVELYKTEDAQAVIVAFGLCSRISKKVVDLCREDGIKIGLIRPITLWPFPSETIAQIAHQAQVKCFLSVEMNTGQMVEDVRLAVNGVKPVYFHGRTGGILPVSEDIIAYLKKLLAN
jgi:2-oxoglutarate ferredoxin oxidoreductase subunit alpha